MSPAPITLALATRARPWGLARCLRSLFALRGARELLAALVVVDNDPAGSAAPVLEALAPESPVPLRGLQEPRPNIAGARNRALAVVRSPWVAFLDDDEVAEEAWLEELWAAARSTGADAVFGPSQPEFEGGAPAWDPEGRFFRHDLELPAGSRLEEGSTRSALVRRDPWLAGPAPFDPAYGLTGCSDLRLFREMSARGARLAWAPGARVREWIPAARQRPTYLLRRHLRKAQGRVRVERDLARWPRLRVAARMLEGLAQVALTLPLVVLQGARSRGGLPARLRLARGLGKVLWHPAFALHVYRQVDPERGEAP